MSVTLIDFTDEKFLDDVCEGLLMILDALERKRNKPIRTSATIRKVFKVAREKPNWCKPRNPRYRPGSLAS